MCSILMLSTLEQVVVFCYQNQRRYNKSEFIGRTCKEWANIITSAAERNKLYIVETPENQLIGACVATERPASKTIWVHDIVCRSNAFPTFIKELFKRFPDYKVSGKRNNKETTYTRKNLWAAIPRAQTN